MTEFSIFGWTAPLMFIVTSGHINTENYLCVCIENNLTDPSSFILQTSRSHYKPDQHLSVFIVSEITICQDPNCDQQDWTSTGEITWRGSGRGQRSDHIWTLNWTEAESFQNLLNLVFNFFFLFFFFFYWKHETSRRRWSSSTQYSEVIRLHFSLRWSKLLKKKKEKKRQEKRS